MQSLMSVWGGVRTGGVVPHTHLRECLAAVLGMSTTTTTPLAGCSRSSGGAVPAAPMELRVHAQNGVLIELLADNAVLVSSDCAHALTLLLLLLQRRK
jgi:hypothetical protein